VRSLLDRVTHDLLYPEGARDWRKGAIVVVDTLTLLMALAAVTSLVARYGFYLSPDLEALTARVGRGVLYGFLGQVALKILVIRQRLVYVRAHIVELVLAGLCLLVLLFPGQIGAALHAWNPLLTPEAIANLYVAITQVALLIAFIPGGLRASTRLMSSPVQPALLIVLSFLLLIALGTGALLLPRASTERIRFVDALFTATSASCVTGLIVVDTGTYFTPLGRFVILVLMQVGGLGIMTLTTFFAAIVGRRGSLKEYATLQTILGQDSIGRIRGAAAQILLTTFFFEAAGAIALYAFVEPGRTGTFDRVFFSIFHAVSAFCNAGFSLLAQGMSDPALRQSAPALVAVMVLIVAGGLGFPVLKNIGQATLARLRGRRQPLSLHARIVLTVTLSLIVLGGVGFGLLERGATLAGENGADLVLHAAFQSITARTAGFNTVNMVALAAPTTFLMIALMWVGASPGSTGGGIRTTSFALVLMDARAVARGKGRVEFRHTPVDPASVSRAHATVSLSLAFIAVAFLTLAITEHQPLLPLLFETFSAAGTVGLSTGITSSLTDAGKTVVILLMFVGRVGFLTLAMALTPQARSPRVDYTAESVPVL
jgi:potassium uptake TrkH family protein